MGNSCAGKGLQEINAPTTLPKMTRKQVLSHNKPDDCWCVIDNIVYDLSQYWKVHPGGGDYIKKWAGKDATLAFREFNHSPFAEVQLTTLGAEVGYIDENSTDFSEEYYKETPLPKNSTDIEEFSQQGDMMCFQCQQTSNGTGCTDMGVCGKSPEISALQDLIIQYLKGLAQYLEKADDKDIDDETFELFIFTFFMTLTNVNFNSDKHFYYLKKLAEARDKFQALYLKKTPKEEQDPRLSGTGQKNDPQNPASFIFKENDKKYIFEQAKKVGINARKVNLNPDLLGLLEMCVYGLKGGCAYLYHAEGVRNNAKEKKIYSQEERISVFKGLVKITADLTKVNPSMEELIQLNMDVGKNNFTVMEFLDNAHNIVFGKPTPSNVNRAPVEGKCILISGHDMMVLKKLLEQTKDQGINIYTHGEMLPAFGYPELRKYPHLVGNFGTAWFNQTNEFPDFPGAILLNSNCLIQPQPSYAKRLFTTHVVGWDDIKHIENDDFSELIQCAKKQPGFKKNSRQFKKYENVESEQTGFGHQTMAEILVPEIKAGNLTEIYLVGGCDNLDPTRSKYLQQILDLPQTAIVLTLGCAKFRLFGHKEKMGYLPGGNKVPRLIDVGQCNDSYSAVKVALALTQVLGVGVNELPLHLVLSWVEQKAVVILLTLLHLGIKNINIGPNLPAYLTPNLVNFLVQNFSLSPMSLPKQTATLNALQSTGDYKMSRETELFNKISDFVPVKFVEKKEVAKNTYSMKFAFMEQKTVFQLQPGQHVIFRAKSSEQKWVSRAYTPITKIGEQGQFEIIVKVYQEGLFSNFLKNMTKDQLVEVQGPCGTTILQSDERKKVKLISEKNNYEDLKSLNLISGGTSCVSMFQMVQFAIQKQLDLNINLIVANSTENLKVLEKEFQELALSGRGKIQISYITSDKEGRISQKIFQEKLIQKNDDPKVVNLIAGPHNFRMSAKNILQEMEYSEENLVQFY